MTSKKDNTPVDFCEGSISQARSQDFSSGGGVRTSITGTKYFNVGMIRFTYAMQVSDDTQGRATNPGTD